MLLPACLESTTLGDVLGCLYRGGAYGALQLYEANGRTHEIELIEGWVERVVLAHADSNLGHVLRQLSRGDARFEGALRRACLRSSDPRLLGERLVAVGAVSQGQLRLALKRLHYARLEQLFHLSRARLRFRPLRRVPCHVYGLGPAEFLHGRRRHRDAQEDANRLLTAQHEVKLRAAHQVLGLAPGCTPHQIRRAYRQAAGQWHPDRFVNAGPELARRAQKQFTLVSDSYRRLLQHHRLER